ncbi:MAG: SAM-dependent methyltransferase [Blastocatellia bacterium]
MASRRDELELRLIARIGSEGPLTFRDFMEAALYDPNHGYYQTGRRKIGPEGDYYTSSNVHPAFGAVLARAFVDLSGEIGAHDQLHTIVEMGAGTGRLAFDVLKALRERHPAFFQQVDYVIVEASEEMATREREILVGLDDHVRWSSLAALERAPITGIFFSNELVDAMPVHRVRIKQSCLEEQYVTVGEGLMLRWGEPSTPRLMNYFERTGVRLTEGQIAEINLDAIEWLARVSGAIERGFLITIDYGDVSPLLYAEGRQKGTLRSFYNHRLIDSPLERVGEQDITASVNFTALMEYGRHSDLETVSYERQVAFLVRMGLIEMIEERQDKSPSREELTERLALKNLFVPGGVSDNFRVLIQRKV